jgi:hypothetical protein
MPGYDTLTVPKTEHEDGEHVMKHAILDNNLICWK